MFEDGEGDMDELADDGAGHAYLGLPAARSREAKDAVGRCIWWPPFARIWLFEDTLHWGHACALALVSARMNSLASTWMIRCRNLAGPRRAEK
jgi:hypothetical protein